MKMNDNIAYAPLPRELKGRRNMVATAPRKDQARFRSGKLSRPEVSSVHFSCWLLIDQLTCRPSSHLRRMRLVTAWTMYHLVMLKWKSRTQNSESKTSTSRKLKIISFYSNSFQIISYSFYNRTEFSGLETHILNSYTNPILQVMHYSYPIRCLAKSHITTNCAREHCLLCELGFVTRMLEDARGTNCQSSNFCKTVGVLAHSTSSFLLFVKFITILTSAGRDQSRKQDRTCRLWT